MADDKHGLALLGKQYSKLRPALANPTWCILIKTHLPGLVIGSVHCTVPMHYEQLKELHAR